MHELRGAAEPSLAELVSRLAPVDLVLVEGFKRNPHPKLEVWRVATGKPPLFPEDAMIRAVASDGPVPECDRTVLSLNDVEAIADFVMRAAGLAERVRAVG